MKSLLHTKTMVALAVAIAAAAISTGQAQDQPMPPPANDAALPPDIAPNTPLAQVIKLVQAGVDISLINNFVTTSASPFNLDADKIIALTDLGVPKDVINGMLDRDKTLYAAASLPPPPAIPPATPDTVPATDVATDTAPPSAPVTVDYFDTALSPYGSWVVVEGYGRCWRPTTVIYDSGWRPYCDRGHWVYTDCGWYWDSDYSWGVTFHYGRWFRNGRLGWCWSPDTEWAPSWVTWRSSDDYCGWAPLPPLAVYRPGAGFFYRGVSVAVDFNFGLGSDCFTFVSPDRFLEHHPRRFCVEPQRVPQVFNHTTIINNYNSHDRVVVNTGISVTQVSAHVHHPIQAVQVGALPNAGRQGWRGGDAGHPGNHAAGGNNNNNNIPARTGNPAGGNGQFNHNPIVHDNGNNDASHHQNPGAVNQTHVVNQPVGSPVVNPHPPVNGTANGVAINHNGNNHNVNDRFGGTAPDDSRNITVNHNSSQLENHYRNTPAQVQQQVAPPQQPPHFTPPVIEHPAPQAAPRQFVAPSQPTAPERVEQHPQIEQHVEQHQQVVQQPEQRSGRAEVEQHSQPPTAAQPQGQSESHGQDHSSSDKDQKNH